MSLDHFRQPKAPRRPRRVFLAGAMNSVSPVLARFANSVFLGPFPAVHHPHSGCSVVPTAAMNCEVRACDDGRVRVAVFSTAQSDFWRLQRDLLDPHAMRPEQAYSGQAGIPQPHGQFRL